MQHPPSKANNTSMMALTHILGLLTGFIGPLIIYLTTQEPEVKRHARLALNWQISWMIYFLVSLLLVFVLIGILLLPIVIVLDLVFCIMAAVKASDGVAWQYPLTISLIKE
ncbi:DUF4870 domain-containing protein [Leptolyngbya sp. KIOST-1]|uniref:DUF4870 domain-containing protein n=1 Tax=Leptolyngbya sp. KIOST-1 TaxID=1229172 RepID=UPI00068D606C|nr:DUF4870 domain-containing protein [Leptolyngbya sp. KIOST-1]